MHSLSNKVQSTTVIYTLHIKYSNRAVKILALLTIATNPILEYYWDNKFYIVATSRLPLSDSNVYNISNYYGMMIHRVR